MRTTIAIFNLMEDAATAEISRAELWFWVHRRGTLDDGRRVTADLYRQFRDEEVNQLADLPAEGYLAKAISLLDGLVLPAEFVEFLTLPAYQELG